MTRPGAVEGGAGDAYFGAHVDGGSGLNILYYASSANCFNGGGSGMMNGRLYAMPFIAPPRGGTVDRLSLNVTALAVGNARVGLYASISETNIYPGALLVDGGEFSTSTAGVKHSSVSVDLEGGRLYWAAFICSALPQVRTIARENTACAHSDTFPTTPQTFFRVVQAYGALPATFPAAATPEVLLTAPAVALRFSA